MRVGTPTMTSRMTSASAPAARRRAAPARSRLSCRSSTPMMRPIQVTGWPMVDTSHCGYPKASSAAMAKSASVNDIGAFTAGGPVEHGGDLAAARRRFPAAPEPFVDLSTGINPDPYPFADLASSVYARLPDSAALMRLTAAAAGAYRLRSPAHIVAAPGTQILLPLIASLLPPGRAAVLSPTYGEFARTVACAGHGLIETGDLDTAAQADLVLLANPNNPDGRLLAKSDLLRLAKSLSARGGLLVVDEAYMDVAPMGCSLLPDNDAPNIVVLRSFGKFFGLAGL